MGNSVASAGSVRLVTLPVCGYWAAGSSGRFVIAKCTDKIPRGWRRGWFVENGKRVSASGGVKLLLPPEDWRPILDVVQSGDVFVHSCGLSLWGRATQMLPRKYHTCPHGWRPAYQGARNAPVWISSVDYCGLFAKSRSGSAADVLDMARTDHTKFLTQIETRKWLERRVCALRGGYLKKPVVDAGWFNGSPTPEQWRRLEVNSDGDVSVESLAREGLLEQKIGIVAPDVRWGAKWQYPVMPWVDPPRDFPAFPPKEPEDIDLAWAEDLTRAVDKATKPYR